MAYPTPSIVQASGTFTTNNGTTLTMTWPAATTLGNTLFALVQWGTNITITTPKGWGVLIGRNHNGNVNNGGYNLYALWSPGVVHSGDLVFTASAATDMEGILFEAAGPCTVFASSGGGQGTSSDPTATFSSQVSSSLLLGIIGNRISVSGTLGAHSAHTAGWTSVWDSAGFTGTTAKLNLCLYRQANTARDTSFTLGCTITPSLFNTWAVSLIELVSVGRGYCNGAEKMSTEVFNSTAGLATTTGRGGVGTTAWSITPSAGQEYATARLGFDFTWFVLHCYINFTSLPTADTILIAAHNEDATGTSSTMAGVQFTVADSKLRAIYRTSGQAIQTGTSSAAVTTGTWYRLELRAFYKQNGDVELTFYLDGVLVATNTITPTAGTANYWWGKLTMGNLNDSANKTYSCAFDDVVLVGDPRYTVFPLGDQSVIGVSPTGIGTNVGAANFSDDAGGAIDANSYTRVDDVLSETVDYIKQDTASESSYIELAFPDFATTRRGVLTVGVHTAIAAGTTDNLGGRIVVGGDEYLGNWENNVADAPGTGSRSGQNWYNLQGTDPVGPDGVVYTGAEMNGFVFRLGFATATVERWTAVVAEACALPAMTTDHWAWAETSVGDSWKVI